MSARDSARDAPAADSTRRDPARSGAETARPTSTAAPRVAPQRVPPPDDSYLRPAGSPERERSADRVAAGFSDVPGSGPIGGLGAMRAPLESAVGADLSGVRVQERPRLTDALGAHAYARGTDIVTRPAPSARLVAHEAAHVGHQRRSGRRAVERYVDPTTASIDSRQVMSWAEGDVRDAIDTLVMFLEPLVVDGSARQGAAGNLRTLLDECLRRPIDLSDATLARLPANIDLLPSASADALDGRIDLMVAMITTSFAADAPAVTPRLLARKRMYRWVDTEVASAELDRCDAMLRVVETAGRIAAAAVDPGGDAMITALVGDVRVANRQLLDALFTDEVQARGEFVTLARDRWLEGTIVAFRTTVEGLATATARPIDPQAYGAFSNGIPGGNRILLSAQSSKIGELEWARDSLNRSTQAVLQAFPDASATLEERIGFVAQRAESVDRLLRRGQLVAIGTQLCEAAHALADAVWRSYQISQENLGPVWDIAHDLGRLIEASWGSPTQEEVNEYQRLASYAFNAASSRYAEIQAYERRVSWFVNLAAVFLGGLAMRGVMGLASVEALGTTGARIVGSLTFTTTRVALTANNGRPLTVGGFLGDAVTDYFLLSIMHGVDTRILGAFAEGANPALVGAARFGGAWATMAAWTLGWRELNGNTATSPHATTQSTGEIIVETGVDLAILTIANALTRAPPSTDLLGPQDAAQTRARIRQAWDALQQDLHRTGVDLKAWLASNRADVKAGRSLLGRAAELFDAMKRFYRLAERMGELPAAQAAELRTAVDAMQESIRNATTEIGLGIRAGSASKTWSYRGTAENLRVYLETLIRQGRASAYTAEPGGVYRVRMPDGSYDFMFPEGGREPVIDVDVAADVVADAAPEASPGTRSSALANLRATAWPELPEIVGSLPPRRGGAFIAWAALPATGQALATGGLSASLVKYAASSPESAAEVTTTPASILRIWYEAWRRTHPNGQAWEFLTDLRDVAAWRGSMDILDPEAAAAAFARRSGAVTPALLVQPSNTPSMWATETRRETVTDTLQDAMAGDFDPSRQYATVRRGRTIVLESSGERVVRALVLSLGDKAVVERIDVTAEMALLRQGLDRVRAAADESSARTELASTDAGLAHLDFLLDLREGVDPADVLTMQTLANHPLRRAAPSAPALPPDGLVCDPNDPLAELPPEVRPIADALPADVHAALEVMAVWDASRVTELLRHPIMVKAFTAHPDAATTFLRTLTETHGVLLYEPHLHGAGALQYAARMATDLVDAHPKNRAAMLKQRLAFGDQISAQLHAPPAFDVATDWAALRVEPEAFAVELGSTARVGARSPLRARGEALGQRLQQALRLGIERAVEPQVMRFFELYRMIVKQYSIEGIPDIVTDLAATGVGGVEVRTNEAVPGLASDPILGGSSRILSIPSTFLSNQARAVRLQQWAQIQAALADPSVVGFDAAGQEVTGQTLGTMIDASLAVSLQNFAELEAWMGAHPRTAAAVALDLRYEPFGEDSADLVSALQTTATARQVALLDPASPLPADVAPPGLPELAWRVRQIRDALARVNATRAQYPGVAAELESAKLPGGQRGITIHAGEQIMNPRTSLTALLDGVVSAVDAGADRIGHGVILGVRLPGDLASLGFTEADGIWTRTMTRTFQRKAGAPPETETSVESFDADAISAFEARRLGTLARIADLGITVEVPPTSNIVLAGLDPFAHPVQNMLADQPSLRVAAATDNPAIHGTDLRLDTALLTASAGMPYPRRVVLYIEGYGSRLGGRPMSNPTQLIDGLVQSTVRNTPAATELDVLNALHQRWPVGAPPGPADVADAARYELALRRILRGVIY